jgi:hypothetical protein
MEGPIIIHIQGIHSTGPWPVLIYATALLRNKRASFVLFVHFENNEGYEVSLFGDNDRIFFKKFIRGDPETSLNAYNIIGGQHDGYVLTTLGKAGYTRITIKLKEMLRIHSGPMLFIICRIYLGHSLFLSDYEIAQRSF